jgi:hypothetical protein
VRKLDVNLKKSLNKIDSQALRYKVSTIKQATEWMLTILERFDSTCLEPKKRA